MTTYRRLAYGLATIIVLASTVAFGQAPASRSTDVPRTLSYQGVIRAEDGTAIKDGNYAITVHLYADAEGTQEVWKDTYLTPVASGVFSVVLGAESGLVSEIHTPLPAALELDRQLWIGTQIGDSPVMKPLAALTASPYALSIPNKSVTAEKMGTDYVGSFSLNGQKISGRGQDVNFVTGDGIVATADPATNTVVLQSAAQNGMSHTATKGAAVQGNSSVTGTFTVTSTTTLNTLSGTTTLGSNAASNPGILNLVQGISSGGHEVGIQAPSTGLSGDVMITLPSSNGTLLTNSRSISTGAGLSGGGDLSADRTLTLDVAHANSWSATQSLPATSTQGDNLISAINTAATTVGVSSGGTGASTASGALNNLLPTQAGNTGKVLQSNGSSVSWQPVTGTGTVSSVTVSGGSTGLTTSGGTITAAGTITLDGTLDVTHGGTGATSAAGAANAILPSQVSNANKYLQTDGSGNLTWASGPVGQQGAAGATGPQGAVGVTGSQGAVGPAGAAGANGSDGAVGPQGPAGPQGAVGPTGGQGSIGATGPQGLVGATGPQGAVGATGAAGTNGNDGAIGPQGPAGPQGAVGATGAVGSNGNDGAIGPQGPAGSTGPQGSVGATGPQGPIGATGAAGTNGLDGATGSQGAVGAAGAQGSIGATGPQGPVGATGAAGTNGVDGATGPQGALGATGTQGNVGATGPQGAVGATGAQGNVGATGPEGPVGATGQQGAVGLMGPQGDVGPIGPQGDVGPIGSQGDVGPMGPAGADGAVGSVGATGPAGPNTPASDNSIPLGSGAFRWSNLFLGGNANVGGTLSVGLGSPFQVSSDGNLTSIRGASYAWPPTHGIGVLTSDPSGNLSWSTTLVARSSILPTVDNAFTLGDATHRFADLYLGGQSIHMSDGSVSATMSVGNAPGTLAQTGSGLVFGINGTPAMSISSDGTINASNVNITGTFQINGHPVVDDDPSNFNGGSGAGAFLTQAASFNTAVGDNSLQTLTAGTYDVAVGYGADVASDNLTNAIAIGSGAIVSASNTMQLGNPSLTRINTDATFSAHAVTAGGVSSPASEVGLETKNGHIRSEITTAPTTTTNGNAGSSASSSLSSSTDVAGLLTLTTGSGSYSVGTQATVNFSTAYSVAPIVVITPEDATTALLMSTRGIYVQGSTSGFTLNFGSAETTSTTYHFYYHVIETQ